MNKTIFITGATSGFGEATAILFARHGWKLIINGRRGERLRSLEERLGDKISVLPLCFDVSDKSATARALKELPAEFRNVDVLVNNAGAALGLDAAYEADLNDWEQMIQTNILGLTYLTHALLPGMVERNSGHIVNIGSIAGSYPYPKGNVYGATKAFVAQFSRNLRSDLVHTAVRVTNIEPGLAETEFSVVRYKGDTSRAEKVYAGTNPLKAEDVAETIYWAVSRPQHVNINSIELMPTCQAWGAFAVHRKE